MSRRKLLNRDRLRRWRIQAGLSQAKAAKRFRVCQTTWSSLELGRRLPGLKLGRQLERKLGLPVLEWRERDRSGR